MNILTTMSCTDMYATVMYMYYIVFHSDIEFSSARYFK